MPDIIRLDDQIMLFKKEVTEGTDSVPTGAANAIMALNAELTPFAGETLTRDQLQPFIGASKTAPVGVHGQIAFDVEAAGAGTAGDEPAFSPLLMVCGLAATVDGGVDVEYDPVTDNPDSGTLYFHMGPNLHAFVGARSNLQMTFRPKAYPMFRFSMLGQYVTPSSAAKPTPDFSAFQDPMEVSNANTPTCTLHGFSPVVRELTINMGIALSFEDLINKSGVDLNDREVTGSLTINATDLADFNPFAITQAKTLAALQLIHGTAAGDIVQIDASQVQIENPRYGADGKTRTMQLDLRFIPTSGNDEIKLTIK